MNNLYKQLEEEWRNNWFDFIKKIIDGIGMKYQKTILEGKN